MNIRPRISGLVVLCATVMVGAMLAGPRPLTAQTPAAGSGSPDSAAPNAPAPSGAANTTSTTSAPSRPAANPRITIEVTGGDKNVAVENASVYVKYVEEHILKKDKKLELNVKTSREGVAHVPNAPLGRALIQVVADGWKSYGHWYEITDPNQEFKIHLERPPKWY
jgi:hypothetical protein